MDDKIMTDSTNVIPFLAVDDDQPVEISLSLENLAELINDTHTLAQDATKAAWRAGEYLLEAKRAVKTQGAKWSDWLVTSCPEVSERMAQHYMRIAKECAKHPDRADEFLAGSLRQAIAKTTSPKKTKRVSDSQPPPKSADNGGATVTDQPHIGTIMDILRNDPLLSSGETKPEPTTAADDWPSDEETRKKLRALLFDLDATQKRLRPGLEGVSQLAPLWDFIEQLRHAAGPRMH